MSKPFFGNESNPHCLFKLLLNLCDSHRQFKFLPLSHKFYNYFMIKIDAIQAPIPTSPDLLASTFISHFLACYFEILVFLFHYNVDETQTYISCPLFFS